MVSGVWCMVSGVWCVWFNDTIVTVDESRRLAACMKRVRMTKAATQTAVTRMVGR